jgi:hypothetical protein
MTAPSSAPLNAEITFTTAIGMSGRQALNSWSSDEPQYTMTDAKTVSLADAELREDLVEQIAGRRLAGDLAQRL